jgi:hypothetical protein
MVSPPPPICLEDFPGEYSSKQEKRLIGTLGLPGKAVSIEVTEPPPVQVKPNRTGIAAHLRMHVQIGKELGKRPRMPPSFDIRMSWALKTHSFVSVVERHKMPTAREALLSPFLEETIAVSETRNWVLSVANWRQDSGNHSAWAQAKDILLPLSGDSYPVPSFSHPNITRRYSLIIRLEATAKHLGKACFDHVVPVQIFYERQSSSGLQSIQGLDDAPRYVP